MSDILSNDIRTQFQKTFATLKGIAETFPEDKWLVVHGDDEFYIPSRVAYHAASYIDVQMMGGFKDPDFNAKLPYGSWRDGTAQTLPDKKAFLAYYEGVLARIEKVLAALNDEGLSAPIEPERVHMGATQLSVYLYMLRELGAHEGELNKMLVDDGKPDVWVSR